MLLSINSSPSPYFMHSYSSDSTTFGPTLLVTGTAGTHSPLLPFRQTLPLEIEENIIDQLFQYVWALRSCALTCRAWRDRCRRYILRSIRLRNRGQFDDICAYLRSNQHLRPLVHSVVFMSSTDPSLEHDQTFPASEILCYELLEQLPNLRRCTLSHSIDANQPPVFNHSLLIYLRSRSHIETLCLTDMTFHTPKSLMDLISALPLLKNLECRRIDFQQGNAEPRHAYARKPTKLRSLSVRVLSMANTAFRVSFDDTDYHRSSTPYTMT